jgi:hypothetical protein
MGLHKAMSWETRGNRRVYYRARCIRGKIVKEYFGHGAEAHAAAEEDARKRAERAAHLEARRERRREYEAAQVILATLSADCDNLVKASLVQAGFHQHKRGEWRKRRAGRHPEETE